MTDIPLPVIQTAPNYKPPKLSDILDRVAAVCDHFYEGSPNAGITRERITSGKFSEFTAAEWDAIRYAIDSVFRSGEQLDEEIHRFRTFAWYNTWYANLAKWEAEGKSGG